MSPALLSGHASAASLAVGLGGVLLGHRGVRFALGLWYLGSAAAAWRQTASIK